MAALRADTSSETTEDHRMYEQLAKLQEVYNQVFELRSLLPDKLLSPARGILESSRQVPPEKLAAQLKDAAAAGSRDVQRFKKDYHGDGMRELFQKVNATELPQGQDTWATDYLSMMSDLDSGESKIHANTSKEQEVAVNEMISDRDAVKRFRDENPRVEITVLDEEKGLPLQITVSSIVFHLESADGDKGGYKVTIKDEQNQLQLAEEVLRQVQSSYSGESLPNILSLLTSYTDLRGRKCEECDKVFDASLQLALARKRGQGKIGTKQASWRVLHPDCAS